MASLTQQVLLATYPELRDRAIAWRIARRGPAVVLEAREAVPPLIVAGAEPQTTPLALASAPVLEGPLVQAVAEVDRDGSLLTLQVDGVPGAPGGAGRGPRLGQPRRGVSDDGGDVCA